MDADVWGFRPESAQAAPKSLENGLKAYASKGHIRWGVFQEDQLIGECRFFDFVYQSKAEVSYWIIKSHRGQGFGNEALSAVIQCGFEVLLLHRIEAIVRPDNVASIALAKKVGFRQEGFLRKYRNEGGRNGVWNDAVVLARLRDDS